MVLISIRVVGEENEKLFQFFEVDPQIHMDELLKRIESVTFIPSVYQQIEFRGEMLPNCSHPLVTINSFENLVLKHALLPQWQNYLATVQEFRRNNEKRLKKEKAFEAYKTAKHLYDAKFFSTYASFYSDWIRLRNEYATFLDNVPIHIREAAKSFFTRKFSNKIIEIDFKDKPSDTRSGGLCIVSFEETRRVFYVKTNHNASSIAMTHRGPLNMIELFIYKLLEILGVGAVVGFIPNVVASDKIVYICGEEIDAFKTLEMLQRDWDGFERKIVEKKEVIAKAIIQLSLLTQILGLGDLNAENIGFNETAFSLFVVDFHVGFIDTSVAFEGINRPNSPMSMVALLKFNLGRFSDLVQKMTFGEQLEIAKECIVQWEISSKLDVAFAKLEEEKEVFKRADLLFGKGTETLQEYIAVVRKKISLIEAL